MTTETPPLNPPLDEYRRQYEGLKDDVRELTEGLSRDQLNWAPAPDKWSIAQCLAHLNRTDEAYAEALGPGIVKARERGLEGGRIRYGILERWFIRTMEPPPRRRFKAPGKVVPAEDHPLDVVGEYLDLKDRLVERLHQADGLDLSKAKIASPLARFIQIRIGAAFAFLAAHDRRHVWQARQVRQHPEFP